MTQSYDRKRKQRSIDQLCIESLAEEIHDKWSAH